MPQGGVMKRLLIVVLAILLAGCTSPTVRPAPSGYSRPAPSEYSRPAPYVIRDETYNLKLGWCFYEEYNWILSAGDHFTGKVLARRDATVQIWLEDPNGVNWAPKECVKKWEWDMVVPEGRDGEWMIRVENTKWFGVIDVNLHMALNTDRG